MSRQVIQAMMAAAGVPVGGLVAWELDNPVFDVAFEILNEGGGNSDIFFKPDGTKFYTADTTGEAVYQYSMSTPWDVNTASYDSKFKSVASEDTNIRDVFFKPDGTKMFIIANQNDRVFQYSLSVAWDVSTATYDNKSFLTLTQNTGSSGFSLKSDGTKMFTLDGGTDNIFSYSLSGAWDISTASYDSVSFGIGAQDGAMQSIFVRDDGLKLFTVGNGDFVFQYSLSSSWDLSTISFDNKSFDAGNEEASPQGLFFKDDGLRFYVSGPVSDDVNQYDLT